MLEYHISCWLKATKSGHALLLHRLYLALGMLHSYPLFINLHVTVTICLVTMLITGVGILLCHTPGMAMTFCAEPAVSFCRVYNGVSVTPRHCPHAPVS